MHDPDPQLPRPRRMSGVRWLLLLLPSVILLTTEMIIDRMAQTARMERLERMIRLEQREVTVKQTGLTGSQREMIASSILAAWVMLCFALGFLVEKWRRGKIKSVVWALNYGFMILIGNGFISCVAFLPNIR